MKPWGLLRADRSLHKPLQGSGVFFPIYKDLIKCHGGWSLEKIQHIPNWALWSLKGLSLSLEESCFSYQSLQILRGLLQSLHIYYQVLWASEDLARFFHCQHYKLSESHNDWTMKKSKNARNPAQLNKICQKLSKKGKKQDQGQEEKEKHNINQ